jgi:hypothetical protein
LDNEQLARVEQQIRDAFQDTGLGWILNALDDAIATGFSEEVEIVERHRSQFDNDLERFQIAELVEPGTLKRTSRTVSANRPLTPRERVDLLTTVLRRLLVDLPTLYDGIIDELNGTTSPDEMIFRVSFEKDVDAVAEGPPPIQAIQHFESQQQRDLTRQKALQVLGALEEEVGA